MLGLDTLFKIRRHLVLTEDGRQSLPELRRMLDQIHASDSYQRWLAHDQFFDASDARSRYHVPPNFGIDDGASKWLLERFGLIAGDVLTVKIEKHEGRVHVTDGSWVPAELRVYPFVDESKQIVDYVRAHGLVERVDLLIDPACGCGHHAMGLPEIAEKVNLDINPRALEFARLNTLLASLPDVFCAENDITTGLPSVIHRLKSKRTLFAVNMPFAIFPRLRKSADQPKPAQDGGERGMSLTLAAIRAIRENMRRTVAKNTIAVVLCYSLGNPQTGRWDILDEAARLFEPGQYRFDLLDPEQKLWRVNGVKAEANPMPLDRLATKATCRHTYLPEQEDDAREGYEELERQYRARPEGWTHLGYGILTIESQRG